MQKDPTLIRAKSISKEYSLLHVAAGKGYIPLCHLLYHYGHETNPVDVDGKTPYQHATSDELKSIIMDYHMTYLRQRFYTSEHIPAPTRPFIQSLARDIRVLPKIDFERHPLLQGMKASAAGATTLPPTKDGNYLLLTVFREDILMLPYYGELLVIHENEQAIQFIDELAKSKHGFTGGERFPMAELVRFEARCFLKFVSSAFEL